MWRFGGHLGQSVSALVDGQLDAESTERAWEHVLACPSCRRLVEREGWVKRQLAEMAGGAAATPPPHLVGSLQELDPEVQQAWDAVGELEQQARGRRRAGIAAVGVGSVSAAVLGLSTLSGAPLGIGGAPAGPPATSLTRPSSTARPVSATPSPTASSAAPSLGPFNGWLVRDPALATTGAVPVRSQR
jgi:hypothetical protein